MLPFVASQAIVLSQTKQNSPEPLTGSAGTSPERPSTGKGLFSRAFDVFVQSRLRKADTEIAAAHRRLNGADSEK